MKISNPIINCTEKGKIPYSISNEELLLYASIETQ